jgi:hypothetical protein
MPETLPTPAAPAQEVTHSILATKPPRKFWDSMLFHPWMLAPQVKCISRPILGTYVSQPRLSNELDAQVFIYKPDNRLLL